MISIELEDGSVTTLTAPATPQINLVGTLSETGLAMTGLSGPQGERGERGVPGPVGNAEDYDPGDLTLWFENALI